MRSRSVVAVRYEPDGPTTMTVTVTGAQIPGAAAKRLVMQLEDAIRDWAKASGGVAQETHYTGNDPDNLQQVSQSYIGDKQQFDALAEAYNKEKAN